MCEELKARARIARIGERGQQLLRFFAHTTVGFEHERNKTPLVLLTLSTILPTFLAFVCFGGGEGLDVDLRVVSKLSAARGSTYPNVEQQLLVVPNEEQVPALLVLRESHAAVASRRIDVVHDADRELRLYDDNKTDTARQLCERKLEQVVSHSDTLSCGMTARVKMIGVISEGRS